jgi:hypothetical protein
VDGHCTLGPQFAEGAEQLDWVGVHMGSLSIWHWVVVLAALATIIPAAKALSRVGLSPWWSILSVIPIVGWFGLWAFAYARWPKIDDSRTNS